MELNSMIIKKEVYKLLKENPKADDFDYIKIRSFKELKALYPDTNPLYELSFLFTKVRSIISEIDNIGGEKQLENDLKWFRLQYKLKGFNPNGYRGIDWDTYGELDKEDMKLMGEYEQLYAVVKS